MNIMKIPALVYVLPFVFALLGWLIAKLAIALYVSVATKRKAQISSAVGSYVAQQFSFTEMEQRLTEPATVEAILPFAEQHIDEFLRKKLPAAMPMLAMFISDKLVADMKAIFMKELKELFPALIKQYLTQVKQNLNISHLVSAKLNAVSSNTVASLLKKQLHVVEYACAATGFVCGFLYIFLTLLA